MTHEAIKSAEVERVARLARLELSEQQRAQTLVDFERILDHVDALQQLDTRAIPPTEHVTDVPLVTRQDAVSPSLSVAHALHNAPERLGDGFGVPKIIE